MRGMLPATKAPMQAGFAAALLAAVVGGSAACAWWLMNADFFPNTAGKLLTPRHLELEAVALALAAFLMADGLRSLRAAPTERPGSAWRYHVRILIGVTIIASHLVVLAAGGYR